MSTFDFDQEISASLNARIGSRLKVSANFDTQSTYNFQNLVKIEGKFEDVRVENGNFVKKDGTQIDSIISDLKFQGLLKCKK